MALISNGFERAVPLNAMPALKVGRHAQDEECSKSCWASVRKKIPRRGFTGQPRVARPLSGYPGIGDHYLSAPTLKGLHAPESQTAPKVEPLQGSRACGQHNPG